VVTTTYNKIRRLVADVLDPELPDLTIDDLGILRDIEVSSTGRVVVSITPTYCGCPAIEMIKSDIVERLREAGFPDTEVRSVLAPAWTTDWIGNSGRRKLRESGIAPPSSESWCGRRLSGRVCCPRCRSFDIREVSRFGSTPCKALYACNACNEPFDYFKAL
jgi:ring-1,2-phenylacetyl-CoA epoxidase subunit PaaD